MKSHLTETIMLDYSREYKYLQDAINRLEKLGGNDARAAFAAETALELIRSQLETFIAEDYNRQISGE
jgi:hypothetical protein